ncbi:pyruvate dehydrogenase (acetyl-transferring), homodimeric type [Bailinhaonella thermotolerans]|uniref:Pyruvate dehydrogenase E1 component n=1 Tax=Bailinhaonella thermotolerans TaxID=1070861 RepID=A0A3A4AX25_9ACTN|nr:pyruvate dehydrogenase (acetyl-transferring), homodimeric type [Bailinhaonella thermotolerans]RJL34515.1 pyruvate dehydrogenase (acetyl-transferring), homodimeric type [Bailinhaonella thermotolerans]
MSLWDQIPDADPEETAEWRESLDALVREAGPERARQVLGRLLDGVGGALPSPYVNSVPTAREPEYPGDLAIEERIAAYDRWNAAAMVTRASKLGLGGHMATYASAAWLYEVGFNHFFHAEHDQVYFQGHASPGVYARAFAEGRLTEEQLDAFRRETAGGLPSYPHPRAMPGFWQFPTVSMGLGPMNAVYQARFNRYLHARGIKDTSRSRVWAFLGDGEMDEPEATAALTLAAREGLDNLVFVINCNLQRLDGPVRGNTRVVRELEGVFRGAGWNVVKALWGSEWDGLLARDTGGVLAARLGETPDGQFQTFSASPGAYIRERLFAGLESLAEPYTDADLERIVGGSRAGHEPRKVHAAYRAAVEHRGAPTVVLAQTVKGWTLGEGFEARNANHQMKKLSQDGFRAMAERLGLRVPDADLAGELPPYLRPDAEAREYLAERRAALGGPMPRRTVKAAPLAFTQDKPFAALARGGATVATTMAFVRLVKDLMKDPETGRRWVPIVPDEARTFGMESLFPTAKIYSPLGQRYDAVDRDLLLSYKEAEDGQILNEGITEAGAIASFTAAATSYATHGEPMVPFYIFYSMFGWQRIGDQLWALADQLGRGFLMGATAGRTTMTGEGLQHADGHSHLLASANPACLSYDPAFAYEIAVIVKEGLRRMYGEAPEDVFYYLTVYNEPLPQPAMPEGVEEGIVRGIYRYTEGGGQASLLASGTAMHWALEARRLLARDWGVDVDVYSVTSWSELRREAMAAEGDGVPYVTRALSGSDGPVIAVSDWMRAVPDQIRPWIDRPWTSLGTDGFGLSDTREAARRHFGVDPESIAVAVLRSLKPELAAEAAAKYGR